MFTHERLKYNMLKSVTKQAYHRQAQSLGLVWMIIFYQNINDTVFNLSRSYEQVAIVSACCHIHTFPYRHETIPANFTDLIVLCFITITPYP